MWLGHAAFLLQGKKNVYIDPYNLVGDLPKADVVLITHPHFDHCSPDDVAKISSERTVAVAPRGCSVNLQTTFVQPGDELVFDEVVVKAVPAYNVGKNFHTKANNWVGYIVRMGGISVYHAGDTDVIPEMDGLSVDVALLPVGGTYTMDWSEALRAVEMIKPKVAVPMHYGSVAGSTTDALNFCNKCPTECKVLEQNRPWEIEL